MPLDKPLSRSASKRAKKGRMQSVMHDLKHGKHHGQRTHEQEVAIGMKYSGQSRKTARKRRRG